jgi:molybdate transport system substrate-binding protein
MTITVQSALIGLALLLAAMPARAEDIKVFSSVAMRAVVEELAPRFERETRNRVVATFGLAAALKSRIEGGDAFDLAILTPAQIDDLIKQGKAAAASRAVIARTGLGLMVRAGAPKLDVGTVEAFKRTLLGAKSLTYVPAGASGVAFVATAKQLGISQSLEAKTKPGASGDEVNANITGGAAGEGRRAGRRLPRRRADLHRHGWGNVERGIAGRARLPGAAHVGGERRRDHRQGHGAREALIVRRQPASPGAHAYDCLS